MFEVYFLSLNCLLNKYVESWAKKIIYDKYLQLNMDEHRVIMINNNFLG